MMGHTHLLIGTVTGAAWAHWMGAPIVLSSAAAGLAALLPDIDHPSSSVRRRMGAGRGLLSWLKHRGITHTLIAVVVFGLAAQALAAQPLVVPLLLGYSSHLLADAATKTGIPLFMPLPDRFYLLPKKARLRSGGIAEQAIAALAVVALLSLV